MILLDMKNSKTSSSPLSLSSLSDKPIISFSELLKGVSEKKDAKSIQNNPVILSLATDEKNVKPIKTALKTEKNSMVLKNEDSFPPSKNQEPIIEINPKLIPTLSKEEIKILVTEAKNYLKAKIQSSDEYKKAEIKELPKTLEGLAEVARKFGIDISKISVESVREYAGVNEQATKAYKQEVVKTPQTKEPIHNKKEEIKIPQTKDDVQLKESIQDKKEQTQIAKDEIQPLKELIHNKKEEIKIPQTKDDVQLKESIQDKKEQTIILDEKQKNTALSNMSTPLFKVQETAVEHTTTQQMVEAKANNLFKIEQKTPKEKADETLKLLLRGEKPSVKDSELTADFSVATAKVIASTATSENTKTLEKLLQGESFVAEQNQVTAKAEPFTVHKSDSFEVKLNEAKQMIKYLSADVKNAIEDYRSPFTRVKVQLNPQNLGEVDLTVVQRGKNLHVNISSNNTAINTLAMNANELKVQLSNSGINNATLNFSNGSQNSDTNAGGQHQQRQNEQRAHEEYNYFEKEETSEEILSSLEIIVPRYI